MLRDRVGMRDRLRGAVRGVSTGNRVGTRRVWVRRRGRQIRWPGWPVPAYPGGRSAPHGVVVELSACWCSRYERAIAATPLSQGPTRLITALADVVVARLGPRGGQRGVGVEVRTTTGRAVGVHFLRSRVGRGGRCWRSSPATGTSSRRNSRPPNARNRPRRWGHHAGRGAGLLHALLDAEQGPSRTHHPARFPARPSAGASRPSSVY